MTINKSQGQTLDFVGVYLPQPVFAHGQLYVACSRVGRADDLSIYTEPAPNQDHGELKPSKVYTRNIVYSEVLTQ